MTKYNYQKNWWDYQHIFMTRSSQNMNLKKSVLSHFEDSQKGCLFMYDLQIIPISSIIPNFTISTVVVTYFLLYLSSVFQ